MHVPRFFRKESELGNSWKTSQKLRYVPIKNCYTHRGRTLWCFQCRQREQAGCFGGTPAVLPRTQSS